MFSLATNICGSDLHMVRGRIPPKVGTVLGHEMTGEIVEVGPDVENFKPGDLVRKIFFSLLLFSFPLSHLPLSSLSSLLSLSSLSFLLSPLSSVNPNFLPLFSLLLSSPNCLSIGFCSLQRSLWSLPKLLPGTHERVSQYQPTRRRYDYVITPFLSPPPCSSLIPLFV
jgi:hypothetical protein